MEDKLIGNDDTINKMDDVEIFNSEPNCGDWNRNDPKEELVDYELIVCSKCRFKTICNT